ncbi:MAG: hypothetical protein P8080_08900, partial [Gammaproteobacteria bacterium]
MKMKPGSWPKGLKAWKALKDHAKSDIRDRHLRDMFRRDPERFGKFSVEADGLLLDYSRNRVTRKTMRQPDELAHGLTRDPVTGIVQQEAIGLDGEFTESLRVT